MVKDQKTWPEMDEIESRFKSQVQDVETSEALEALRLAFLGRKGEVTQLQSKIKELPNEQKPSFGKAMNQLRNLVTSTLESLGEEIKHKEQQIKLKKKN